MAALKFEHEQSGKEEAGEVTSKLAVGMYSKDGEYVDLAEKCDCDGQVCKTMCYIYIIIIQIIINHHNFYHHLTSVMVLTLNDNDDDLQ